MSDLIELSRFIFMTSWSNTAASLLVLIFILVVNLLFFFTGRYGDLKSGLVILNVALSFYVYHAIFESGDVPTFRKNVREGAFVSSQIVNYLNYRSVFALKAWTPPPTLSKVDYMGESGTWYRLPENELPDRLLLVVNEAWGVTVNPRINEALLKPFLERRDLIGLKYGDAEFKGATVAAELRELCYLWPNRFNLRTVETGFENCLPNRLKREGYTTYAMHGATGEMYDRLYWYPRAGFEKQTFFETKQWPAKCVSFPGACDLDMRNEVVSFFDSPGKRFMYWLTLNTHAFYNLNDLRNDVFDCEMMGVETDALTCSYLKLQAQFFYGLAEMIDDPRMVGVTVRVIGDHAPPIPNVTERHTYFKDQTIGWLEFTIPRGDMNSNSMAQDEFRD